MKALHRCSENSNKVGKTCYLSNVNGQTTFCYKEISYNNLFNFILLLYNCWIIYIL